jgi:signal transduction histidine kinase
MKKVALVFVIAVLLPSLVLAWLALRSLRDQQFLLERQQLILCQNVTDGLAQNIGTLLSQRQQEFSAQVENLAAHRDARAVAASFDRDIRAAWPLAEVGFCVTRSGEILSPSVSTRSRTQNWYQNNGNFFGNRESAEVYGNVNTAAPVQPALVDSFYTTNGSGGSGGGGAGGGRSSLRSLAFNDLSQNQKQPPPESPASFSAHELITPPQKKENFEFGAGAAKSSRAIASDEVASTMVAGAMPSSQNSYAQQAQQRKVTPQNSVAQLLKDMPADETKNLSRVMPAEGEFTQLIGDGTDGMLARFLQNKLSLMFWHRLDHDPDLIFGAQLDLNLLVNDLRQLFQPDPVLRNEIYLVLLDDNAKPVAWSDASFQTNPTVHLKRPFVATEVGEALPHWEVAAYLIDPAQFTQAAHTTRLTLGLLVAVLMLVIGIGSLLIVRSLNFELKLARQKTDFVSNVSHELKTPLTSIRMFSELLAEGRVTEPAKQRSYLNIITAEAARLTRLINNVLDFSRMESGEKKYNFTACDLAEIVRSTVATFRPHLEANRFKFDCEMPGGPIPVQGDADALAQVIVNLLSNAEKYSNGSCEIIIQVVSRQSPLAHVEISVLDRGTGVPPGSGEKIFEKFYRAHDSLSSGIQGSGLGLTIARQIARAHGGDVVYESRPGGGSRFILRLPVANQT